MCAAYMLEDIVIMICVCVCQDRHGHERGKPYQARHQKLVGRWLPDGRRATKAAAAYTGDLNEGIAYAIASSAE